jgi:hypothetical protein
MAIRKKNQPIVLSKKLNTIIDNHIERDGKLPKAFKKKWLKALRSGKYTQGTEALRSVSKECGTTYCCLGVACHVAGASGIKNKELIENCNGTRIKSINKVPVILRGDLGIPIVLANLNDKGKTFEQLADLIEEKL